MPASATHAFITLYLSFASVVIAGFVLQKPVEHTRLMMNAYLVAAVIATVAALIGYFGIVPQLQELFTGFGRARGTFKDPNVYGPFLVPAMLYALHLALNLPLRRAVLPIVMLLFLTFAIFLSFSRGAWFNAVVAVAVYIYFSLVFARSNRQRIKMMLLGTVALASAAGIMAIAAQFDGIGDLLSDRAALTQSYDVGPQGRFGGHEKAKGLILENPLGLGALVFATDYHHEDVHNVYLTLFLSAGWAGGFAFFAIVWMTALLGLRHAMQKTATQSLFLIAYAAFLGNALEGFVIDIDHWRHFYLEMGIVWGLMVADRSVIAARAMPRRTSRLVRGAAPGPAYA